MSQPSNLIPSPKGTGLQKYSASLILREQPDFLGLTADIAVELTRLAKVYSIQFTEENAAYLAQWLVDEYPCETLETIQRILKKPPPTAEKVWKLNPDTIREWMGIELERQALQREKEIHNSKHVDVKNEWADERLEELKEITKRVDDFVVPSLTEEDIIQEGQVQPKQPGYIAPDKEYYIMNQLRVRYGKECTDLHTGEVKEGMPTFFDWMKKQKI